MISLRSLLTLYCPGSCGDLTWTCTDPRSPRPPPARGRSWSGWTPGATWPGLRSDGSQTASFTRTETNLNHELTLRGLNQDLRGLNQDLRGQIQVLRGQNQVLHGQIQVLHGQNQDLHGQIQVLHARSQVVSLLYLILLPVYQKDHCRVILDLFSSSGNCWGLAWGWTSAAVFQ